jgi:hypothetical protein
MEKGKVTAEELEKSLQYLDAFAKGEKTEPVKGAEEKKPEEKTDEPEEKTDEPEDELYIAHKNRLAHYLDKAMCHKGYMDKIKAGEPLPDEAFDDLEDEKPVEKGNHDELNAQQQEELVKAQVDAKVEEIVKAKVAEALDAHKNELAAQKEESDKVIKGLQEKIEALENQPVKKTIIKGADAITLKKALSGEKVDDKTLLSISLQKGRVSDVLFEAYEAETDEITKARIGDAIAEFESTGNYISPEIADLMEKKGYRFIK